MTPPFRAEHVGSLLRPKALLEARERLEGDQYAEVRESRALADLRGEEDKAIRDAVALQEEVGLEVITDGEFRRRSWYQDFVLALEGTAIRFGDSILGFQNEDGEKLPSHLVVVEDKLRRTGGITTDAFTFLKEATARTPKVTMPSPSMLHFLGGRPSVSASAYPDLDALWADLIEIYRAEIRALWDLGCRYVQFDDVTFAIICDPKFRAAIAERGEHHQVLMDTYASVLNAITADRPAGMTYGLHTCRGNNRGLWMAEGGYDVVAETVLKKIDVDAFFFEFDSERAGDFAPLRHLPDDKRIVLGLVTTKTPELEKKDALKRRIEEAAAIVPLDHICLSPQCGFASNFMGNPVTIEDERKKLALVVETAHEVWG
ncbi:MAG: 5-methyltetrahydropteroyltriglutamate--homocysteine S-methyltransferase [Alphaproteobacteria bacterium]